MRARCADSVREKGHAKRRETKEKRLDQMLDELEIGGVYMSMKHPGSKHE